MRAVFIPQLDELVEAVKGGSGTSVPGGGAGGSPGQSPASANPYRIAAAAASTDGFILADRTVNKCDVAEGGSLRFVFPPRRPGFARDFLLRLTVTADAAPELVFAGDGGECVSFEDADESSLKCEAGVNVFAFTETDEGIFMVNRKVVDIEVEVGFDACGGELAVESRGYKLGAAYAGLPKAKRAGYVFLGWFTEAEGGMPVSAGDRCRASVTRLYAHWEVYVDPFADEICPGGGLVFTTEGMADWGLDRDTCVVGSASARSGFVADSQSTALKTTVAGPGTLSFSWKVSSEANYDKLELYVDAVVVAAIDGEWLWTPVSHRIEGGGEHEVEWRYTKDGSQSSGQDAGWVDDVSWTPEEP